MPMSSSSLVYMRVQGGPSLTTSLKYLPRPWEHRMGAYHPADTASAAVRGSTSSTTSRGRVRGHRARAGWAHPVQGAAGCELHRAQGRVLRAPGENHRRDGDSHQHRSNHHSGLPNPPVLQQLRHHSFLFTPACRSRLHNIHRVGVLVSPQRANLHSYPLVKVPQF